MKFQGIKKDVHNNVANESSPFALNIRVDDLGNVVEDMGFDILLNNNIFSIGRLSTNRGFIIFGTQNGVGGIWLLTTTLTPIIISNSLNFSINHPIEAEYSINKNNQFIVVWTDNYNPIRYYNIDCNNIKLDANYDFITASNVDLLLMFPNTSIPNFTLLPFDYGNVNSGAYQIAIAYIGDSNDTTNYIAVSNWITVTSKEKIDDYTQYDGGIGGVKTKKAISLTITDLDVNYSQFKVAIIQKQNLIITAYTIGSYRYTGTTRGLVITGNETQISTPLETITVPNDTYLTAKTLIHLNNKLHVGNLTKTPDLNYQRYANNIKIKWVNTDNIQLTQINGSYKDEVYIFNKRGFKSNDVYAFYFVIRLKDGTYNKAYHIPNTLATNNFIVDGNTVSGDLVVSFLNNGTSANLLKAICPTFKVKNVVNNADVSGTTGLWENSDEVYPTTDCSDIYNATGLIGTLRGLPVKHHRFPSISQLENWGLPYVVSNPTNTMTLVLALVGNDSNNPLTITSSIDTLNNGTSQPQGFTYRFTANGVYELELGLTVTTRHHIQIKIIQYPSITTLFLKDDDGDTVSTTTFLYRTVLQVTAKIGDFINVQVTGSGSVSSGFTITPQLANSAILQLTDLGFENINAVSKILGISISDVYIPTNILKYVDSWEIWYAEKTIDNSLVLNQAMLVPRGVPTPSTNTNYDCYNFDSLINKPQYPVYFENHIKYNVDVNTNLLSNNHYTIDNRLGIITSNTYIPADAPFGVAESLLITLSQFTDSSSINNPMFYLGDLMLLKRNLYNSVFTQTLISTGQTFKTSVTSVTSLYGGDIFRNTFGWRINIGNTLQFRKYPGGFYHTIDAVHIDQIYTSLIYASESVANIGMRHVDNLLLTKYVPHDIAFEGTGLQGKAYNKDYNSINNTITLVIAWCLNNCNTDVTEFPDRVIRSSSQGVETSSFNWRLFKVNDYYELPKQKGAITKLNVVKQSLTIHTKYSYFIAYSKDKIVTSLNEVFLGQSDIFERDPDEPITLPEGFAGCNSQWGAIITPIGEIFIDINTKHIFAFTGRIEDIGKDIQYWLNLMEFSSTDNPFVNQGVCMGYDKNFDRIFVTNKNAAFSFTLSFDINSKTWISYHTFKPNMYMWDNVSLLSVSSGANSIFAKHNKLGSNVYYMGVKEDAYIDVLFRSADIVELHGIEYETFVLDVSTESRKFDVPCKAFMVYSANQCSGLTYNASLQNNRLSSFNTRQEGFRWSFSQVRDKLLNKLETPIDLFGNLKVGTDTTTYSNTWFKQALFINSYVIIRLVFENNANHLTYLIDLKPKFLKAKR